MGESALLIVPTKFILLLCQILLLVIVILNSKYHVELDIGILPKGQDITTTSTYSTLIGLTVCWIGLSFVEFVMLVVGSSVLGMFQQLNLI